MNLGYLSPLLLWTIWMLGLGPVLAAPDVAEVIRRVDEMMRPAKSFQVEAQIETFRDRARAGSLTLETSVRVPDDGSEPDALSRVMAPEAERGKVILRLAGVTWLLAPGAERPVKLSGQPGMPADASLEDLVPPRLVADYTVKDEGDDAITDATGRAVTARRLALSAKTPAAPYPALRLWTDGAFHRPVKLECLTAGGRVARTVFYDQFRGFLGSERPTELTIVDGITPGRVTRIRFSRYAHREWPADYYQPDRMAEWASRAGD